MSVLRKQQLIIWKVAWKLARRQVQRSSIWMNLLTITIMTLTFLNMVVITGLLVGFIEGSFTANKAEYSGDVIISENFGDTGIDNTYDIRQALRAIPQVESITERYIRQATIEANYQTRWEYDEPKNSVSLEVVGIEPSNEDTVTNLSQKIVAGEYLNENESGYILIGANNLEQYTSFSDTFEPLKNVTPGTRVKLTFQNNGSNNSTFSGAGSGNVGTNPTSDTVGGRTKEFIVKGIIDSKVGKTASRAYLTQTDWQLLVGAKFERASEFAIKLEPNTDPIKTADEFKILGFDNYAEIETAKEAIPSVLNDLETIFTLLGNIVGLIAVLVSAITVFVVIYVNALTRRKQIGILKGIGIDGSAIQRAYIMQSLFYATIGTAIGYLILFYMLIPYFNAHPLDFPISDGVLAASAVGTFIRACILLLVTAIAGYLPAWLIVRQNTLDSILGR